MNQRAQQRVHRNASEQRQAAKYGVLVQQRCRHAGDEADKTAQRQVKIVDGDDQHLGDGRQGDRHRQIKHKVHAHVTHGPGLHNENGDQQHRE